MTHEDGVGVVDDETVDIGQELVSLAGAHQPLQRQGDQIRQVLCGTVHQQRKQALDQLLL